MLCILFKVTQGDPIPITLIRLFGPSLSRMEWNFLSGVGAVFLGYYSLTFVLQVLHGIRAFVLPTLGIKKNLKKLGQWAGKAGYMRFTCANRLVS